MISRHRAAAEAATSSCVTMCPPVLTRMPRGLRAVRRATRTRTLRAVQLAPGAASTVRTPHGYCTHHCTVAPQVPAAAKARRAAAGDASAADATGGDGADDAFDLDAELDKIIGLDAVKDM